ncbi:hypothetical protein GOODEAATRI_014482 [Goodea atripinnis]|uniref:Uncharacterized protein n=1 Tax=Goodea atripinnis TaxID=208336 RepID=A0ABV0NUJ3_9TELE
MLGCPSSGVQITPLQQQQQLLPVHPVAETGTVERLPGSHLLRGQFHIHSSPELVDRFRELDDRYEAAVRVFYCCSSSFSPHLQSAVGEPASCLHSAAGGPSSTSSAS